MPGEITRIADEVPRFPDFSEVNAKIRWNRPSEQWFMNISGKCKFSRLQSYIQQTTIYQTVCLFFWQLSLFIKQRPK